MFTVCTTFKMPENDKDISFVIFKNKDQKENHSKDGSFCSSPTLQIPGCLFSWHILVPMVSYISYIKDKDTLTSCCVQIFVLPCGSVLEVTPSGREQEYNYRVERELLAQIRIFSIASLKDGCWPRQYPSRALAIVLLETVIPFYFTYLFRDESNHILQILC